MLGGMCVFDVKVLCPYREDCTMILISRVRELFCKLCCGSSGVHVDRQWQAYTLE